MNGESGKPAIGVFGAGWVGLVTGSAFADLGHRVVIRDVLPERIELLNEGRLPFHEPGLAEVVERNRERLTFTLDAEVLTAATDLFFACVDTPPTASGDADLSSVWSVIDHLGNPGESILVMKSTVPVGTGERIRAELDKRGLGHVGYVSNPEFLAEGRAVHDFMNPDRIVIGSFVPEHGARVAALYDGFEAPVLRTSVPSAEMVKLAANAFLATRISFINEIANVCEAVGADVEDVAKGVGLDHRLGPHFLRAGIGFGGSCLVGDETVLVRRGGKVSLTTLEALFAELGGTKSTVAVEPSGLEVLSWRPEAEEPEFLPVAMVTRRPYEGEILEVRTKMGRRIRCTPDHPFVAAIRGLAGGVKEAANLTTDDWLPLAQGMPASGKLDGEPSNLLEALPAAGLTERDVIVRRSRSELAAIGARQISRDIASLVEERPALSRAHDIVRSGALRLNEHEALALPLEGASLGTVRNGTYVPALLRRDESFWRVVGFYLAGGHVSQDGPRSRLIWSFHPRKELSFVEELLHFWTSRGVKATLRFSETAANVSISTRLFAAWWLRVLGLGSNCYQQRLPDEIWDESAEHKRALLRGLWMGDGSWSHVNRGPSVILEYGTVSRDLADGVLRLLGELGIVASVRIGRTRKSTCDTYWLRISGADQVEQTIDLVPSSSRAAIRKSLARQKKRTAPTGYARGSRHLAWVRVTDVRRCDFRGMVYSLEVPGSNTFVTSGGLVVHNCFPKDVSFLKLLAGNSGYHFQLVSAVMEVNELQKRRVVQKLKDHLGSLRRKRIALLGLAFKPDTDDMREAPSIVLAARLQAEGAEVRAWDPLVRGHPELDGVVVYDTALEAVRDVDAAVIVTEWDELRSLPSAEVREAMHHPLIVDGRNLLDPEAVRAAGFEYEGIGRA
jgi:UDPglucose 6-dehydrogenase